MAAKKVRSLDFFTYARRAPDSGYGILLDQWDRSEEEARYCREQAAKFKDPGAKFFYEGREHAAFGTASSIARALGLAEFWSPVVSQQRKGGAS